MMADKDITKVNTFFQNWKGANALFNKFTSSHNDHVYEFYLCNSARVNTPF